MVRAIGKTKMKRSFLRGGIAPCSAGGCCYFHGHHPGDKPSLANPEIVKRGAAAWHFDKNGKIS